MVYLAHSKLSCYQTPIIVFVFLFPSRCTSGGKVKVKTDTQFVKTSCGLTIYPKLCFETLSPYVKSIKTSPIALANAAVNVSLTGVQSTLNDITKLSREENLGRGEAQAILDCVENLKDSVTELQECLVETKDLVGLNFEKKMKNVMTWVSAALTDEDSCMDGFEGNDDVNEKVKGSMRSCILYVAKLTSNALALINNIVSSSRVYSHHKL